ncbi:XRE family transcriptional regulator [Pararhizobium sp. LjRoot235]|uniref:helix-turn-helix domain-containing protein n=1 Tax=Pararhizobium sp. LjRoot235 TaxID=3342291 RepID=UPI003ECCF982
MTDPATGTAKLGSGNYLKDRGYADPAEMRIKFLLSNEIALSIEDKALSQKAPAELTGLKQPDISRIANGNVGDYSVWRLMRTLSLLGKDIVIDIHQSNHEQGDINANIAPAKQAAGR